MMTLSKIANLAHVSVSTVSKAFSMSSEVSDETRELIFKIAKENNCFKKFYNAKYPKFVVAVICPEFKSYCYYNAMTVLQQRLAEHNCEICVASTDFSADTEKELIEYYTKYATVDGIIAIGVKTEPEKGIDIPFVAVNSHKPQNKNIIHASANIADAVYEAVAYFAEKGVKDVGFIGEERTMGKFEYFCEGLKRAGLAKKDEFIVITPKRFEEGGYRAMQELFRRGKLPRAIVCAYDYMAMGAIRCIKEQGMRTPGDIAIVGMDNSVEGEYFVPSLTSIGEGGNEFYGTIANEIMNWIEGKPYKKRILQRSRLKKRESSEI